MEGKKKNIIPLGVTIGGYEITNVPVLKWDFSSVEGVLVFVKFLFNTFIGLSALVAVAMIIYSGYLFITSAGDAEKIEKGRKGLTAAIVGMFIVFIAKALVLFLLEEILV